MCLFANGRTFTAPLVGFTSLSLDVTCQSAGPGSRRFEDRLPPRPGPSLTPYRDHESSANRFRADAAGRRVQARRFARRFASSTSAHARAARTSAKTRLGKLGGEIQNTAVTSPRSQGLEATIADAAVHRSSNFRNLSRCAAKSFRCSGGTLDSRVRSTTQATGSRVTSAHRSRARRQASTTCEVGSSCNVHT
jgi:hypothetical protein